jgi:hypothetical protein
VPVHDRRSKRLQAGGDNPKRPGGCRTGRDAERKGARRLSGICDTPLSPTYGAGVMLRVDPARNVVRHGAAALQPQPLMAGNFASASRLP